MTRNMFKLRISIEGDAGLEWRDLYLDVNHIYGWYVPPLEKETGPSIVIFVSGDAYIIKQEPRIMIFLEKNLM